MSDVFKNGDIVLWTYKHFMNRKQFTYITKRGTFIRHVKYKKKHLADWAIHRRCIVKFDGNKTFSNVDVDQLKLII